LSASEALRYLSATLLVISFLVFISNLTHHLPWFIHPARENGIIPTFLEYFFILRQFAVLTNLNYMPIINVTPLRGKVAVKEKLFYGYTRRLNWWWQTHSGGVCPTFAW
jgi:hypothetical protein